MKTQTYTDNPPGTRWVVMLTGLVIGITGAFAAGLYVYKYGFTVGGFAIPTVAGALIVILWFLRGAKVKR